MVDGSKPFEPNSPGIAFDKNLSSRVYAHTTNGRNPSAGTTNTVFIQEYLAGI
jgi:hypothetical protein